MDKSNAEIQKVLFIEFVYFFNGSYIVLNQSSCFKTRIILSFEVIVFNFFYISFNEAATAFKNDFMKYIDVTILNLTLVGFLCK